jgi:phosphoenolpyruvate carboxykinase (GTP)
MSDYFAHWLNMGEKLQAQGAKLPKMYYVNWFRKNAEGKFVWPGFGDNMRVLQWILSRADGATDNGVEHFFGISPRYEDLNWRGLDFTPAQYATVTSMDKAEWQTEMGLHAELFEKLKDRMPAALEAYRHELEAKVNAL